MVIQSYFWFIHVNFAIEKKMKMVENELMAKLIKM